MIPVLSLHNLLSWSAQAGVIAFVGAVLPKIFRIRHPRSHLAYCYLLLAACIVLPFIQPWQLPAPPAEPGAALIEGFTPNTTGLWWTSLPLGEIAGIVLLSGVLLKLCFFVAGLVRLRHYRKTSVPLQFPKESILSICKILNRQVEVAVSAHEIGPVTLGWLRPIILLPDSFLTLEEDAQQAILCHELLHVTRHDWLANFVEELIGSILWFHPGVWWLLSQTKLVREQLVDSEVIRLTDAREPYIHALLAMAGAHSDRCMVPAPLFLRRRHLSERMHLLLADHPTSAGRLISSYVATTALLGIAVSIALTQFPLIGRLLPLEAETSAVLEASPPPKIYSLAGGTSVPRVISQVEPRYSDAARQARRQGTVLLEGTVQTDGSISGLKVVRSLDAELDHNALYALKQWRFEPGKLNGSAVPVQLVVEITFSLR